MGSRTLSPTTPIQATLIYSCYVNFKLGMGVKGGSGGVELRGGERRGRKRKFKELHVSHSDR